MPLAEHLTDELQTLTPELMEKLGEEELVRLRKDIETHLMAYDPKWFLCSGYSEFRKLRKGTTEGGGKARARGSIRRGSKRDLARERVQWSRKQGRRHARRDTDGG